MFYLSKKNLVELRLGSLFFGTGGGLSFADHGAVFTKALKTSAKIPVKKITEFAPGAILASVYGVGDPSKNTAKIPTLIKASVKKFQKLTGTKIDGLIPGEIGAEGQAFQTAAYLSLPVLDSDLVGGRAAPEIQLDVFSVFDLPITPVLGVSITGKSIFLEGRFPAQEIEKILRPFFADNGSSGILVGYAVKAGVYKRYGLKETLSKAMDIGRYLQEKNLGSLLKKYSGRKITQGLMKKTSVKSSAGFLKGQVEIGKYSVEIKNENMAVYMDKKKIAWAPDVIVLLDVKNTRPIHNTELHKYKNKEVALLHFPAVGYWKEKKNKKMWNV
ncbi:MAG: hypothetical protein A3F54_05825 [Candidatus Kerfeldbacteria bacterium RIFCSPHIGHO2_12_FULL_48_17]|uniref:DUF917 domain-containing protein n=1 Tax=Candidatus Kerfeldbacteria bacterium RIFCSPHIGHO2_12_FULL_48_17 TaxID=1798542 RepID=A0A1G2AZW8_9BACT|nr:MAG: hypothetical protein A3F54_05825 [Candidatus Kerfeldbacteria bacterium RIFCSPHIGHO2_12_FULL_48_17]